MRLFVLLSMLLVCRPAFAGDEREQAPPPPSLPRGWTPPPSPATPTPSAPQIDEERLAAIVDAAVERAMARRQATAPAVTASPQGGYWTPPLATPQARTRIVPAEQPRSIATVPVYREQRQYAQVLVPPGCCRRAIGAVGAKMVQLGQPRVRTMRVAPAAVVQEVQPARAVYASGQGG